MATTDLTYTRDRAHDISDQRRYAVHLGTVPIGHVVAKRTESWRQTSTGVRYSKRGNPLHWEAYNLRGERIDYRHYTRTDAAEALLREHTGH